MKPRGRSVGDGLGMGGEVVSLDGVLDFFLKYINISIFIIHMFIPIYFSSPFFSAFV